MEDLLQEDITIIEARIASLIPLMQEMFGGSLDTASVTSDANETKKTEA